MRPTRHLDLLILTWDLSIVAEWANLLHPLPDDCTFQLYEFRKPCDVHRHAMHNNGASTYVFVVLSAGLELRIARVWIAKLAEYQLRHVICLHSPNYDTGALSVPRRCFTLVDMRDTRHIRITHDEMLQLISEDTRWSSFPRNVPISHNIGLILQHDMAVSNRHVLGMLEGIRKLGFRLVVSAGYGVDNFRAPLDIGASRNVIIALIKMVGRDRNGPMIDRKLYEEVEKLPRTTFSVFGLVPVDNDEEAKAFEQLGDRWEMTHPVELTAININRGMEEMAKVLRLLCQAKRTSHVSNARRPI
jgi:hypothetical protein